MYLSELDIDVEDLKRHGPSVPAGCPISGSYLVDFTNGDQYVGRTSNIILRIGSHRRTWDDIARIRFRPDGTRHTGGESMNGFQVPANRRRMARPGVPLRKVDLIDPGIDPVLDRMRWADEYLVGRANLRPPERPDQRERTRPLFDRLQQHPDFDAIVRLAAQYLTLFVPAPAATEVHNWVITAMPSTIKTRFWHRLICLSINNVEAMTIGQQFDGDCWRTLGFISANPTGLDPDVILPEEAHVAGVFLAPAWYATVGPVYQIGFDSLDAIWAALDDDEVLDLIGGLAMRLMKRGRGLYGRFHDFNLADAILGMEGHPAAEPADAAGREGFEPSEAL